GYSSRHATRNRRKRRRFARRSPDAAWTSMASLDANAGIRESARETRFDARRVTALDMLEMQRRPHQDFDAALQHAAGGTDAGLVLIKALRGRISAHADVHAVVITAPIGVVEQDEIE